MVRFGIQCVSLAAILLLGLSCEFVYAANLSALAPVPDWASLDRFQETITKEEFQQLLDSVYAPEGGYKGSIVLNDDAADIQTGMAGSPVYRLRFAESGDQRRSVQSFWKAERLETLKAAGLKGLRIALDPGHLGGRWAKMEERWFQIDQGIPVTEGDMTLRVANLLRERLEKLGAAVTLVRSSDEPVTDLRPVDLREAALAELRRMKIPNIREDYDGPTDPLRQNSIRWQSELLFYRIAEIRARARLVNEQLKPDLVICLHFNAEPWGDPVHPSLVEVNHLHLLVNGAYSASELAFDDVRLDMLKKLLGRGAGIEMSLSEIAGSMAKATSLPPYIYPGKNARPVGKTGYVWQRNLLANRLYECPVLYLEPYVMNSQIVYDRIQEGDYEGTREFQGHQYTSIYREYADAVMAGIAAMIED